MAKALWAEKYRPTELSGYTFQSEKHKQFIDQCISDQSIPHLILRGHRGTGKTTLAYILKNALNIEDEDFKKIEASDKNSVDVFRSEVSDFMSTMATGDFKVVLLDEADYLSPSAQALLRGMLERNTDHVRFILTCNHINKIIPEIRSRCSELVFSGFDRDSMLEQAAIILKKEKVKAKLETLETYIDIAYPDFRKLLQLLKQNTIDNVLTDSTDTDKMFEYKLQMIDLMNSNNWEAVRNDVCANISDDEWPEMYRFLYEYLHEITKFKDMAKWKAGIIIIADHLYKHAIVADAEINAAAMFIRLGDL